MIDAEQIDETIRWAMELAETERRDVQSAIDAVMFAVGRQIEQLHDQVGGASSLHEFKGLILPRVRLALAGDPSALREPEARELIRALERPTPELLPRTPMQDMPRQVFGKAPPPLSYGFWRRVARRGAIWGRGVKNILRSR
jgi:hypothetical protein